MKDGVVQQIGTPQEIYANPSNMFVAGFIGAPQMNFIDVTIKEENGNLYAVNNELKIALDKNACEVLNAKNYVNKEVVLGIRPENIHRDASFVEKNQDTAF